MLRLVTTTVGPVDIAPGANGTNQTVEVYNAGDGTLSPTVSSSVSWLTANAGTAAACHTTHLAASCIPVIIGLNTASVSASATPYTGTITVSDPNAVDAPQTITVTVAIGGSVPSSVNVYVPPYVAPPAAATTVDIGFSTSSHMFDTVTTQDGAKWLSLVLSGAGSVQISYPYTIIVSPQPSNMAGNTYTGSIVTSGSSFAPDNKTIPVTMNVTTLPIAQPSVTQISEQLAVDAPVTYASVTLTNSGLGTLAVSGAGTLVLTPPGSGQWLTATVSGNTVQLTINTAGLTPGTYSEGVTITSNAANSPTSVPVYLTVVPDGPPTTFFQGVVDNAVFGVDGTTATPGDIVALFGEQLSYSAPAIGNQLPLVTELGGSSVMVNGEVAPLYFTSYGQIDFQIPVDIPAGTALVQVATEVANPMTPLALAGNTVSLQVAARAPRMLLFTAGYGAIIDWSQGNHTNTLPLPPTITLPGYISNPASPGDVLEMYAIGLGPTSPAVGTGQPAPSAAPLAQLTSMPTVIFSEGAVGPISTQVFAVPSFAGLAPGFVGLYQVNATIPAKCPAGTVAVSLMFPDGTLSNAVNIEVQ